MRLPNVFTAVADVTMGYVVTHGELQPVLHFALLVAASCLLYLSGMVLNDVFDAEVDARERPERPIPSGRISLNAAAAVGWAMLATGIALAWLVTFHRERLAARRRRHAARRLHRAVRRRAQTLAVRTAAHGRMPISQRAAGHESSDRSLGQSGNIDCGRHWHLYRRRHDVCPDGCPRQLAQPLDCRDSRCCSPESRYWPRCRALTGDRPPLEVSSTGWYLLWAALALITARRCVMAIFEPSPPRVQAAVRHCVQSIIVLDAAVCVGYAGAYWGFAVLALLIPTLLLTMWLNAT